MLVKSILDSRYKHSRALDTGLDERLTSRQILGLVTRKSCNAIVGVARLKTWCFTAPSARIRAKNLLTVGRGVSIAEHVLIDATSTGGVSLGESSTVDVGAVLRASGVVRNLGMGIRIGDRSAIGAFDFLHGGGGIVIGNDCLLGPNVSIFSENHVWSDPYRPIREQGEQRGLITIGNDVWIGAGSIILAGVSISDGAIVGAGAVVANDVSEGSIVAGVPARQIGTRGEQL